MSLSGHLLWVVGGVERGRRWRTARGAVSGPRTRVGGLVFGFKQRGRLLLLGRFSTRVTVASLQTEREKEMC